jgi:ribose transport system permease protein
LVGLFSILRPSSFGTTENLSGILSTQTVPVILAISVLLVLVIGHFDLSGAANLGLAQVLVIGLITVSGWTPAAAILFAVGISTVLGAINGLIIVRFKVGSFITTLATSTIIFGVQLWYTNGETLFRPITKDFTDLGRGYSGPIPNVVLCAFVACLILWFLLNKIPMGRKMYVVGGSARAARLIGIRADRYVVATFALAGLLAGIGGVMLAAQLGTAQPGGGDPLLIPAFTGALLSPTTIQITRFNVAGAVVAILVLATTVSGLQQLGAPTWVQPIFNGVALIIALSLSGWAVRSRAEAARRAQLELLSQRPASGAQTGASKSSVFNDALDRADMMPATEAELMRGAEGPHGFGENGD